MDGSQGEPVFVWLRDGRPARFVWRGRMYTVMLVLGHRVRPGVPEPAAGGDRDCWRVEATPLHTVPPEIYELCHDRATDKWLLSRI